jgi:hypothetical protein
MELDFFSFTVGFLAGGGIFGFGLLVGMIMNRDVLTRQVKDEEFDPEAEVADEAFFEEQWTGVGDFPTDAQLEDLHRHSTY